MQFDIPKVRADRLPLDTFLQDYYVPEKPVLITGIKPPDEPVIPHLLKQQDTVPGFGFIGARLPENTAEIETPDLVNVMLARIDIIKRTRPMRIWAQRKGHHTLIHYDGNSLHGLNWQVNGSKQWTLISPDTPPRFYPFSTFAMTRENFLPDARKHNFCQFQTTPGDLLFLPRYWSHSVTSLERRNTNLNWVWTPRTPNLKVAVGRRECAVLAWRNLIPGLSRLLYQPASIHNYGGGGEELFQSYSGAVGRSDLMRCLVVELLNVALLPFYHRIIIRQAERFAKSSISTLDDM